MKRCRSALAGAGLLVSGVQLAHAQAYVSRPYSVVASGHSIELAKYAAINPDCSSMGPTGVNLIVAPHGGEVQVGEGRRYMAFAPNNPRSACNRRQVRTTFVLYRSQPGFVGQDSFVIEAVFPTGTAQKARLYVNVR